MQAFNRYLCSTVRVARAALSPQRFEASRQKVPQTMSKHFDLIGHQMLVVPSVGDRGYTVCAM